MVWNNHPTKEGGSVTAYPCTKNNLTLLCPKSGWKLSYLSQRPPRLKQEIIPNPSSCYQGRYQNAQNAQTRGEFLLFHAGGCVHSVLMASIPLLPNGLIFFSEIGPFWAKRFKIGLILDVFLDVLL